MMNLETPNQETPEQTGGAAVLLLDDIFPHPDNPWDVKPDDEDMSVLKASIEETGLQNPILVRPRPEGGYEMLSGHRRMEAFRQLGLCEIPAVILDCGKEEGISILLNSNKYRTHFSLREQCRATALEYNQYKHQGQRSDPGDQAELHSRETIAKRMGKSPATISRMIRLSKLAAPFFGIIEKRKLTLQAANQLAVLDAASQQELLLYMEERDGFYPNAGQAKMLVEAAKKTPLTLEDLYSMLGPAQPQETLPDEPNKTGAAKQTAEPTIALNIARLCETLGITEPDHPEALIDIVYDCLAAIRRNNLLPPLAKLHALPDFGGRE